MAYNTIQIKYSISNSAIPELLPGELAYTQAGNNLFIGAPDGESGTIRIGGKYTPGILTANQALVANSTGGINVVYATNVDSYYVNAYHISTHSVNTDITHANAAYVEFLYVGALEADNILITGNSTTGNITTEAIISNTITANVIDTVFIDSATVNAHNIDADNINVGVILANGSAGDAGTILYSSGAGGNSYWGILALDSTVVNTSGDFTLSGNIAFSGNVSANLIIANSFSANLLTVAGALSDSFGNTGVVGSYLTSTGSNTVQWKAVEPPYYYSTEMYDYTEYGIGWMNVAPNQNAETLGFRTDVNIPFGAIWILAINDGLVDEPPITIYSPSTRTTPMLWMSIDGSGPYDPDTNPNGQAYWFNITPPPSGA